MLKKLASSVGLLVFASSIAFAAQNAGQSTNTSKPAAQSGQTNPAPTKQTTTKHRRHHKKHRTAVQNSPKSSTAKP